MSVAICYAESGQ